MTTNVMGLLKEIVDHSGDAVWMEEPHAGLTDHDPTAKAFRGRAGPWLLLVVSFSIENQGHPAGSRGYDGTAVSGGKVVRLTHDLAEKLYKAAEVWRAP